MLVDIGLALLVGVVTMIVIGTVVKAILGLRSGLNWLLQTTTLVAVASYAPWVVTLQAAILVALPTVVHVTTYTLRKVIEVRAARGHYGEEAKWAYELFDEGDQEFLIAQQALPQSEITEVAVIANSKQELRELMIDRYEELSTDGTNSNL